MCAGLGSGGKFRKVPEVPESSGACWCMLRRQAPWRVPESSGVRWCRYGGRVRKVPESYGVVCCLATLTGAAI